MRESTDVGMVVAAVYDASNHALLIVGDGTHRDVSPSSSEIARAVLQADVARPYVSIDPVPGNLEGSWMTVAVDAFSKDSEIGWAMFEADRMLKSYSLGADTVTHFPISSAVAGYRNSFEISLSQSNVNTTPTWSRFWFKPAASVAEASATAFRVVNAKMNVQTEIMNVQNGELVSSNGATDPVASEFTQFVSAHLDELAVEEPAFAALEQVQRLLMLADWAKLKAIPFDRAQLYRHAGVRYPMLRATPALSGTVQRTTDSETRSVSLTGGVDFTGFQLTTAPASSDLESLSSAVVQASAVASATSFDVSSGGKQYRVYSLPLQGSPTALPAPQAILSVPVDDNTNLELWARPLSGGRLELILPWVAYADLQTDQGAQYLQLGDVETPMRWYELFDPQGKWVGRFENYDVDQDRGQIVITSNDASVAYKLYVLDNNTIAAVSDDGSLVFVFDSNTGKLVQEQLGSADIRFKHSDGGGLSQIVAKSGSSETPLVDVQLGSNGTQPLALTNSKDATQVQLRPQAPGTSPATLTVVDEGLRQSTVVIQPQSADWTTTDASSRLDFLNILGPEILKALATSASRPVLIPYGNIAVLLEQQTLEIIPFSTVVPGRLSDEVKRRGHSNVLGVVPDRPGLVAILYAVNASFEADIAGNATVVQSLVANAARDAFELDELAWVQALNTDQVAFVILAHHGDQVTLSGDIGTTDTGDDKLLAMLQDPAGTDQAGMDKAIGGTKVLIVYRGAATRAPAATPDIDPEALLAAIKQRYAKALKSILLDDKPILALINYLLLTNVHAADTSILLTSPEASQPAQVQSGTSLARSSGIPVITAPDDSANVILVTDLDDQSLEQYFEQNIGSYIQHKRIYILRLGHDGNPDLDSQLILRFGLRGAFEQGSSLDADSMGQVLTGIVMLLNGAGSSGVPAATLVESAVSQILQSSTLSDAVRSRLMQLINSGAYELSQLEEDRPYGERRLRSPQTWAASVKPT